MITLIVLLLLVLMLNCFFNGCEIGLISSQRARVAHYADSGHRRAAIIQYFMSRPQVMLSTTLVGVNVVLVAASYLVERILVRCGIVDEYILLVAATAALTPLLLISEILAKDWFRQAPEERCFIFAKLLYCSYWVLAPLVKVLAAFAGWFIRQMAADNPAIDAKSLLREDFRILLRDSEAGGVIDHEAANLLDRALGFHRIHAGEVMVPLRDAVTVGSDATVARAVAICREHGFSRLPVKEKNGETPCRIRSVFSLYDAIFKLDESQWETTTVSDCCRLPAEVGETQPLREILIAAQAVRCQLVVVVGANGSPVGIATPADVTSQLLE